MDNSLVTVLEKILDYTASADPYLREFLRPGLSLEEIEEKTQSFNFELPEEVKQLYQWHDGTGEDWEDHRFLEYHDFLSLDEAVELYHEVIADYDPDDPDFKGLLPLFEFEGEYYLSQGCFILKCRFLCIDENTPFQNSRI